MRDATLVSMQSLACNQATHLELQCRLSASLHRLPLRLDGSVTLQPPVDLVRFSLMHEELQMLTLALPSLLVALLACLGAESCGARVHLVHRECGLAGASDHAKANAKGAQNRSHNHCGRRASKGLGGASMAFDIRPGGSLSRSLSRSLGLAPPGQLVCSQLGRALSVVVDHAEARETSR